MMSSPVSAVTTNAGRCLLALKSEKGNGTTTTSPFTNLPMLHLLRGDSNLCPGQLPRQPPFPLAPWTIAWLQDTIRNPTQQPAVLVATVPVGLQFAPK